MTPAGANQNQTTRPKGLPPLSVYNKTGYYAPSH